MKDEVEDVVKVNPLTEVFTRGTMSVNAPGVPQNAYNAVKLHRQWEQRCYELIKAVKRFPTDLKWNADWKTIGCLTITKGRRKAS